MKCIKCNAYVYSADKFCRNCGTPLQEDNCKYGDNITNSKYDSTSCHTKQYEYSYNYSNKEKPSYNVNANHEDQYNYSYKYSYDPSKYDYVSTSKTYGDDKYLEAYIGQNYEAIKKTKFSFPVILFGVLYLLYRKVWGHALLYIIISLAANILLNEDIASVVSLILNIYYALKFNDIYMKKVENHVERIKQENLDKTSQELLNICKKKGGTSMFGPIVGIFVMIIIFLAAIGLLIYLGYRDHYSTDIDTEEEIVEQTSSNITYTLPNGFSLTYESGQHKNYSYSDPSTSTYCHIIIDKTNITSLNPTEEDYLKRHLIKYSADEILSEPSPISYNNRTWKYAHLETQKRSETQYVTKVNDTYYVIKTYDTKYTEYSTQTCNTKYSEFMNSVIITTY